MNNPSIKKMVTRQDKRKVESRRAKEVRLKREQENEREGEKMMLEWSMLKKMWKKKKENVSSMSSVMRIFKLCPLENILAHISHLESLSPESSGHVDLQTLPT